MAGIALTGLASGMDTEAIIAQLIAAESSGKTQLNRQQIVAEQRVSVLQGIQGKLATLKTAASALSSVGSWLPTQTVSVGDGARLGARLLGGVGPGTYSVTTLSLASSSQKTYTYTPPASAEAITIGSFTMTVDAGMSLDDLVREINAADNGLVAVNAQGKLVVSSESTGAASTFTESGSMLTVESQRAGADASYTIDDGSGPGPVRYSSTNVVEHGIPGVELTLKKVGVEDLTVSPPGPDIEAMVGRLKDFVNAYNAVMDASRAATTQQPVKDANTTAALQQGVLFGDQSLVRMQNSLRVAVGASVGIELGPVLAQFGISTAAANTGSTVNQDAVNGKLSFDETKAREFLASKPAEARKLLAGDGVNPGFVAKFGEVLNPLTDVDTGINARIESQNDQITRIKKSLTAFDERLSRREDALRAQFASLEMALARAQAQQAEMNNQISAMMASLAGG